MGLAVAVAVAFAVAVGGRGGSAVVTAGVVVVGVGTFLAVAMATKVLAGEERLTCYHHQLLVAAAVAVFVWVAGSSGSVLAYVDGAVLGVGGFLACGRVGCFVVGCCHGRPSRWGVRYGPAHVAEGFPPYLQGVLLFPVALVEAAGVGVGVLAGGWVVLVGGWSPGAGAAVYGVAYAGLRFGLEGVRGDDVRPSWWGVSEAQWTSVLVAFGLSWATGWVAGWLLVSVLACSSAVLVARHRRPSVRLVSPRHVHELADAMAWAASGRGRAETSLGVLVSGPVLTVSWPGAPPELADRLRSLLSCLPHAADNSAMNEVVGR